MAVGGMIKVPISEGLNLIEGYRFVNLPMEKGI